jgi:hypothetical protein
MMRPHGRADVLKSHDAASDARGAGPIRLRKEVATMTTIKATCPTCGDVDLTPADVTVTVAHALGWSTYTFRCVTCWDAVCKPADDDVVQLLTGAGVRVERLDVPMEYLESRAMAASALPLTDDDLLDFALWLHRTDDIIGVLLGE